MDMFMLRLKQEDQYLGLLWPMLSYPSDESPLICFAWASHAGLALLPLVCSLVGQCPQCHLLKEPDKHKHTNSSCGHCFPVHRMTLCGQVMIDHVFAADCDIFLCTWTFLACDLCLLLCRAFLSLLARCTHTHVHAHMNMHTQTDTHKTQMHIYTLTVDHGCGLDHKRNVEKG